MILILSPAKSLDFRRPSPSAKISEPFFEEEKNILLKHLIKLNQEDLEELMGISKSLAKLNHSRFNEMFYSSNEVPMRQAIFAYNGEAYRGLNAKSFSENDLDFAQTHLRILSGFYGLLRPLDLIQPYRLEMGVKLKIFNYSNLYEFWEDKITSKLNADLTIAGKYLINLASDEYSKVINRKKLNAKIITPVFYDKHNGVYKMITVYAKNARGAMSNFVIKNKITKPEDIKDFNLNNYKYSAEMSKDEKFVFLRS